MWILAGARGQDALLRTISVTRLTDSGLCYRILSEDKVMVEQLQPELLEREVNVKADGVQTAFRKVLTVTGFRVCAHPPIPTSLHRPSLAAA